LCIAINCLLILFPNSLLVCGCFAVEILVKVGVLIGINSCATPPAYTKAALAFKPSLVLNTSIVSIFKILSFPCHLLSFFEVPSLSVLVDLELGPHIIIVKLHMFNVMRLTSRKTAEHVALRFQILQLPMQLTYIDVVVSRLVILNAVFQNFHFLFKLLLLLFETLIIFSK
jgi:hypothetical protein